MLDIVSEETQKVFHSYRTGRLLRTLMHDDDGVLTLVILNCYCEKYIEVFLEQLLPNAKVFFKQERPYGLQLDVANSSGIIDDRMASIFRDISKLRNNVAHEIDSLFEQEKHQKAVNNIVSQIGNVYDTKRFRELKHESETLEWMKDKNEFVQSLFVIIMFLIVWIDKFATEKNLSGFLHVFKKPESIANGPS